MTNGVRGEKLWAGLLVVAVAVAVAALATAFVGFYIGSKSVWFPAVATFQVAFVASLALTVTVILRARNNNRPRR